MEAFPTLQDTLRSPEEKRAFTAGAFIRDMTLEAVVITSWRGKKPEKCRNLYINFHILHFYSTFLPGMQGSMHRINESYQAQGERAIIQGESAHTACGRFWELSLTFLLKRFYAEAVGKDLHLESRC